MSRKVSSSAPSASYVRASSTGSPASRSSWKLMPLTTRPASTSRHGMTRTARLTAAPAASRRERVLEGEPALVERGPDDRALDAVGDQPLQGLEVGQLGDAARGDDRAVGGGADVAQQLEVRALEHAVLVDVGDDVAGAALGVEPGQHVVEVAALAGPAARGERPAADVEPDRDPVAVLGDRARRTTPAARARRCRC